ncbi:Di-copper centre-containing protein [Ascodesmis nigricans]|uniref:Di-copper centre-containing protein n=1 Tax=Ascodesmis nigricans TaxID=341454 RepID=A0A4S2N177_9PEZI|nr:Di-copper centre-containing protein [Ascodesmis nigricans]
MKLSTIILAAFTTLTVAVPLAEPQDTTAELSATASIGGLCIIPKVRREWRTLSKTQKKSFIDAVLCLAKKPKEKGSSIGGARTRWDEFQGIHNEQTPFIHFTGIFVPWHRYFLSVVEDALVKECGYKGGLPYWDWLIDAESGVPFEQWPIFDPVLGFGGNGPYIPDSEVHPDDNPIPFPIPGRTGGGCVSDGPFTFPGFKLSINGTDPHIQREEHCLRRDFSPSLALYDLKRTVWDETIAAPDFHSMWRSLEGEPRVMGPRPNIHHGGHNGVGGELGQMGHTYNSPADPIFYLHHANLDRAFTQWQLKKLPQRWFDVHGNIQAYDFAGANGNITLAYPLNMGSVAKTRKVIEVMNTWGGPLCYTYA